jgi:zinc protease
MTRVLAILLVLAALLAGAEPAGKVFPFPYTQEDLPNGLRLVTIPTGFPNIVSLYIVVQVGSRHEVEPGKSGYAHLFEHLMFRGTPQYPADKYGAILKAAGADQNASTSPDLTTYYINFSKEDLETMIMLEADRFQNLKYSPEVFRTETLAVLGEYNKSVADPSLKLYETLQDTAFTRHPYKHLTIGTLADIQDMPNQYDYGIQFFQRYYRPEYTTVIVAGDVTRARVRPVVEKYWGKWKRGSHKAEIPSEPRQEEPREANVSWPTATLPLIAVAYHAPAFSDKDPDWAALNLLAYLGFSPNSELYQKLVIQEQKVDDLDASLPGSPDPHLFTVSARIKSASDIRYVRDQALATLEKFAQTPVEKDQLETVKQHLRNQYSLSLNNTQSVAVAAARALRGGGRDLAVIERLYALYARITPQDLQNAAQKYLHDKNRAIVTLTGGGR